jgi:hypothetical protein
MKSPLLLDRCWSWLVYALVGEELDENDDICGAGTLRFVNVESSTYVRHLED